MHKAYQRKEVYWFVLTTQNLHWFTGNDEKVKEFTLPLENLKLKDLGAGGVLHTRYVQVLHLSQFSRKIATLINFTIFFQIIN